MFASIRTDQTMRENEVGVRPLGAHVTEAARIYAEGRKVADEILTNFCRKQTYSRYSVVAARQNNVSRALHFRSFPYEVAFRTHSHLSVGGLRLAQRIPRPFTDAMISS